MHHLAVAWAGLRRLHPAVLLEAGIDDEALVGQHPRRWHLEFVFHLEDGVRLADPPALWPLHRSRQVTVIALGTALLDPGQQCIALFLGQPAVVGELAEARISVPGRHPLLE